MKIWQIATGESGRDYREIFFDYDVMILGPSDEGNAKENTYRNSIPNSAYNQIDNFANKPQPGDKILMRFGKEVIGLGKIPKLQETYSFNSVFNCVYGWDLQHTQRVVWAESIELGELSNIYQNTKQKPSFTQVHETQIISLVNTFSDELFNRELKELPQIESSQYSEEELGVELFRAGISNKNIDDILLALRQASRLSEWYSSEVSGKNPSEFEVVSHIIVPLFLGLGWSHQQIAVEWQKVDVALFKKIPRSKENCLLIIEAKSLGTPLSSVINQPINYIRNLSLSNVKTVVITDGDNLFTYKKSGDDWDTQPTGYINVNYLNKEYILPKNTNLVETLVKLQPSFV